jgi:Tol biopolymer transport system component
LEVRTQHSGAGNDPDGIVVVIDAAARHSLLPDTTLLLPDMAIGHHSIAVDGLGPGCTLSGPNPRDAIVVPDSVVQIVLEISCALSGLGGTLLATVLTHGSEPGDSHSVVVDDLPSQTLAATDSIAFTPLSAGEHLARLGGVRDRCSVAGMNPWPFQIQALDTVRIVWQITCWPPPGGRIAFARVGQAGNGGRNVFIVGADGKSLTQLTFPDSNFDMDPQWSPDGTRIAFSHDTSSPGLPLQLRVLHVASGGLEQLPTLSLSPSLPRWSPDGTQLSFEANDPVTFEDHVYLLSADGRGGPRRLANVGDETQAKWSPDGTHLAFLASEDGFFPNVYVIDRGGTNPRPVSPDTLTLGLQGGDFDWAPDGTRIVFSAAHGLRPQSSNDLYVVRADGSGLMNLTSSSPVWSSLRPRWSPDGRLIAYSCSAVSRIGVPSDICTISPTGELRSNLTNKLNSYLDFEWSPDGSKLVFGRPEEGDSGSNSLFIMNVDGTGLTRLTGSGAHDETPSWTQ